MLCLGACTMCGSLLPPAGLVLAGERASRCSPSQPGAARPHLRHSWCSHNARRSPPPHLCETEMRTRMRRTLHALRMPRRYATATDTGLESSTNLHVPDGVVICGAGLAGLCLAAALDRKRIPSVVLEQRHELSREGAAIALWGNAMKALEQIGLADIIRKEYSSLRYVRLCRDDGRVLKEFAFDDCVGGNPELIGVDRARLQNLLYEAAGPKRVMLDATVASVGPLIGASAPAVALRDGREASGRLLVGADGVRSVVASALAVPAPNFAGQGGYRGIARFGDGLAPVAAQTVCQIWGTGVRAGLYPLTASDVYWFVSFDCSDEPSPASPSEHKAEALRLVAGWHHGITECVRATADAEVTRSRFYDRWPLPGVRVGSGLSTLVGDALHPMTPNLGQVTNSLTAQRVTQGGCTALEDGIVLAEVLAGCWHSRDDGAVQRALGRYEAERASRCLPIGARSRLIGAVLQARPAPIRFLRDTVVARLLDPGHFFDHTLYDCAAAAAALRR